MKRAVTLAQGVLISFFFLQAAHADCVMPEQPELPDGAVVDLAAMVSAQQSVKAYLTDAEGFLDCLLEQEAAAADLEATPEAQAAITEAYDAAVVAMKTLGDAFNEEIRKYKSRSN